MRKQIKIMKGIKMMNGYQSLTDDPPIRNDPTKEQNLTMNCSLYFITVYCQGKKSKYMLISQVLHKLADI